TDKANIPNVPTNTDAIIDALILFIFTIKPNVVLSCIFGVDYFVLLSTK
ncbi:MAG: hypothetical protein ACI9FB_004576, partial [Candidatus Azotimanducaceae bacterium]